MENQGYVVLKNYLEKDLKNILNFWEVNSTRTWSRSYIFSFQMENQGSHSCKLKSMKNDVEKILILEGGPDKDLALLLRISIQNGK